jgi:hypothetical protein
MSSRTVLALVLAPLFAGGVYGLWVASSFSGIPQSYRVDVVVQMVPAVLFAAIFEIFILLPLFYFSQRSHWLNRVVFFILGVLIWFILTAGLLWFAGRPQLAWSDSLATSLMLLLPGVVLVGIFGTIVPRVAKA